jgi:hypothetical protein
MKINLHIDRLTVHGISLNGPGGAHARQAIEAAVVAELTALLATPHGDGLLRHGGAVRQAAAPTIALTHRPTPGGLGRQVAGAIHQSLSTPSPKSTAKPEGRR